MKGFKIIMSLAIGIIISHPNFCEAAIEVRVINGPHNFLNKLNGLPLIAITKESVQLMEIFNIQYENWTKACGKQGNKSKKENRCHQLYDRMRETRLQFYSILADDLPELMIDYEKGADKPTLVASSSLVSMLPSNLNFDLFQSTKSIIPEIWINVQVISADNSSAYIDPKLESTINDLKKSLKYTSFKMLDSKKIRLQRKKSQIMVIRPDTFMKIFAKSASQTNCRIHVEIYKNEKPIFKTIIESIDGSATTIGAHRSGQSQLLVKITPKYLYHFKLF